jgi:glycosyltransferase involved in cell wall biosynthesis
MKVALVGEGTYPHQFGGVSVWCDQLVRGLPQYDFTLIPLVATGNEPMRWELPDNVKSVVTIPLWGRPPALPLRARLSRRRADSLLAELVDVLLTRPDQAQDRFSEVMHELFTFGQTGNLRRALLSETGVKLLSDAWRQQWPDILPESAAVGLPNGLAAIDGDHFNGLAGQAEVNGRPAQAEVNGRPAQAEVNGRPAQAEVNGRPGQDEVNGLPGQGDPGLSRMVPTVGDAVTAMQLLEHALRPFSHPPVQADVVHTVTNGLGALPAFAAKWRHGVPMIVTEHGVYMREQYLHLRRPEFGWPVKDLYLRFLRRLCTLGYHEADIITPGNIYNKRWEAELGADEARVRTVYNGVDPAVFPVVDTEPEAPTISWAGRIDPFKDLITLLRAFSLVVREMPEARLRIFGSAPQGGEAYLEHCRAEAYDLGISKQATFEGRVPEIRDAYAAGHVVVLCSITEGFPYTLIEAMACGRPCVATNVGGVTEALGDDAGLVVPPRNPAALADACLKLLRDDGMRRKMGVAARERAIEHFTVDRAISAFDEMYTRLGSVPDQVPAAGQQESGASSRSGHWITLPAEEESTLVGPRPETVRAAEAGPQRVHTDEEMTQILPALGQGWQAPAPGPAVLSGALDSDMTQPLAMLRAPWPGLPVADPEILQEDTAEPDVDQTMILPVAAARPPELSVPELPEAELSEAELSESELSESELSEAGLSEAGLSEAGLSEAGLSEAGLSEAELSEAGLSEAELSEANRGDEGEEFTERGDEDRTTAGSQLTEAMR